MALDPNIALQVKPIEIADPLASYGRVAAIQNAQNQNALAQYQLGAAQRAETRDVARMNALAQAGNDPTAVANALLKAGDVKGYSDFVNAQQTRAKQQSDLLDSSLKRSREFLSNVTTPEQYLAWHQANHADPVLGPALAARGVTPEQTMEQIQQALQTPNGFQELLNKSKLGVEKFAELNKPHYFTENLGGTSRVTAVPGLGGKPTIISETKRTATPGELMVDARARDRLTAETAVGSLSPQSVDLAANIYLQTGQLPPGMGTKASSMRAQVMNRATELAGNKPAAEMATDVIAGKQDVAAQAQAVKAFNTGVEGRKVVAFNTAINHLDTMSKLADALQNNDMRAFNIIGTGFARQTGSAAPTNFDTAKSIVGSEVAKAVAGAQMALADRKEIREQIDKASSPEQLRGAINTLQELLGGQLSSLRQQYETSTKRKDFDAKLSPRAKQVVSGLEGQQPAAAGPVKISGDADYDKLPSGAIFIGPDGQQRRKP